MLTRQKPFAGATRIDTMVGILEREPRPLCEGGEYSPAELAPSQRIVDRALCKRREDRYQTTNEMLTDLKQGRLETVQSLSLADSSAHARQAVSGELVKPSSARHLWTTVSVAVLLGVLIAGGLAYRRWVRNPQVDPPGKASVTPSKPYSAMSEAEQLAFVDVQANHVSTLMGDRPVKLNDDALRAIKRHVDHLVVIYGSGKPDRERLSDLFARATPYVPLIARSFRAHKVPVIIGIYLPMIESAYRNCYENSIGAKGLYQFVPATARVYGVAPEDMCDVEKMTPAAAQYIADHMAELGDDAESMTLVLLSYNTGAEWVRGTLRELRETDHYQRNFWTLLANREKLRESFQNESAGYVPRFFAAAIIGENPQAFGVSMPPLSTLAGAGEKQ
ncbi:MAG TPA: transglycosylase SLT domain-containing protein [Pyrinomonadaceae bacterium]|nr:transglycosylase SLT domain-containing protein [Pyrinomonadaceae bacterium]